MVTWGEPHAIASAEECRRLNMELEGSWKTGDRHFDGYIAIPRALLAGDLSRALVPVVAVLRAQYGHLPLKA